MIPALTVVIGMYVLTRMADLLRSELDRTRGGPSVAAILSLLTMLVTVVAVIFVLVQASQVSSALEQLGR